MPRKKNSVMENSMITAGILFLALVFCLVLLNIAESDNHVLLIFVLAVLFVSRYTDGYVYGIAASMIAVLCVNYVFTIPYFQFDFTLTGYPLTFFTMLAVSWCVSALTTRLKNQEEIRLEAEKEKMRGNLLRAISHDIRTPLTSIAASASGMIENYDLLPEEQKIGLLNDIREEAQWLNRIVENLLSVTRISNDGGGTRLDTQDELAEEIISGAVGKFNKRFPEVPVEVKLPDEALLVPMEGILIEQVLVNLLENSVLHGKDISKVEVIVWKERDRVVFSVEDDGQGIKASVLPVMFDGIIQDGDVRESESKRNMGIGLSVCKSIVKAHNGNMKAENKAAGGARVMFWLPLGEE